MATQGDDPYSGFAFRMSLAATRADQQPGSCTSCGLDRRVELLRYRAGNDEPRRHGSSPVWQRPTWLLRHLLPTSLTGPTLNAIANEVAIETLTIVSESLTVE